MDNKKNSLQGFETTAMDPPNTGKGKLLYEIGLGLVGEIAAIGIAYGITIFFSGRDPCRGDGCMGVALFYFFVVLPAIFALLAIPLVCECVRFAGMHSGGHKRRRGCYKGIAIALLLILLCYPLGIIYLLCASPIFLLVGAIIGYRSDAT